MLVTSPRWDALRQALPLDNIVRLELQENIPIFRAIPSLQSRVETLLEKQQTQTLNPTEQAELLQYEELDDFLSLVNRLVRNVTLNPDTARAIAA